MTKSVPLLVLLYFLHSLTYANGLETISIFSKNSSSAEWLSGNLSGVTSSRIQINPEVPLNNSTDTAIFIGSLDASVAMHVSAEKSIVITTPYQFDDYKVLAPDAMFVSLLPTPKEVVQNLTLNFPGARVGVLHRGDDYFQDLQKATEDSSIKLVGRETHSEDIFKDLRFLLKTNPIDIFLITADPEIYSSANVRYLIEALYRKRIPTVALTDQLLGSGVIGSIYVPNSLIVESTIDLLYPERVRLYSAREGAVFLRFDPQMSGAFNNWRQQ
jgi:hypothetical protein